MRRWLRCLVCLLVICALLVNLFPVKAEATAAGAVGIAKASLVTGNPAIIVGAALLAVGVAAGVESGAFENLVDNAVSYLDSAGSWIADGSMQLLQTVTEAGETAYYVAGDLLESLRSWLCSDGVLVPTLGASEFGAVASATFDFPVCYIYLGWLNWFFPVGDCLVVMAAWLVAVGLFYLYSILMRWLKMIGD